MTGCRPPNRLAVLTLLAPLGAALAGCGGGAPYVLTDYRNHQRGLVEVCYDHRMTPLHQAQKLADEICVQYDRMAAFQLAQRDQCNWRTPDIALFYCVARPGETPPPFVPQKAPLRSNALGG